MKNKILTTIILIMILFQAIMPIKADAFTEKREIISVPAKIENQKSSDQVSETTGLDTKTGILLEPTVKFFTVVIDSILEVLTAVMTQSDFEFVMVKEDEIPQLEEGQTVGATITLTEEEMTAYKNVYGILSLKYPNFSYSPEEIFAGNLDLLEVNFIERSNEDGNWNKIRNVVSEWYKTLRMFAIVGLLSVLIYTGIKIIISSNTKNKAKYKEFIVNWFIAVLLAFSLQYIMAFILNIIEQVMGLLDEITGLIEVNAGGTVFTTNLIGLARFQLQQQHFSAKVGHLVIYTALVVYTFKFTFIYLKRVLKMAFLTVISPIVALTYPIDKMNGKAKGFEMWLREFLFNALLQPLHYILYYILVSSSLSLAAHNPIYGIVALMFISNAEKLLKKIFGFDKATAGPVGGIAGAFATGAIVSRLTGFVKDPLHPFGGGKGGGKGKSGGSGGSDSEDYDAESYSNVFINDIGFEDFLSEEQGTVPTGTAVAEGTSSVLQLESADNSIEEYRDGLAEYSNEDLGGVEFNDESKRIDALLSQILLLQGKLGRDYISPEEMEKFDGKLFDLQNELQGEIVANEAYFKDNGIPLQYSDGDSRSTSELMDEIMRLRQLSKDTSLSQKERQAYATQARKLLKRVKRRMAENKYMQQQGDFQQMMQQKGFIGSAVTAGYMGTSHLGQRETAQSSAGVNQGQSATQNNVENPNQPARQASNNARVQQLAEKKKEEKTESSKKKKFKELRVVKGVKNVAKTMVKPVIETDKDFGHNAPKLTRKIAVGLAGVTLGIGAAAVQAGISITDGKYHPLEGVATVGAGIVGASKLSQLSQNRESIRQTYRNAAYTEEERRSLEDYSRQWYNRDDIIENYNREFPGQGKQMRKRAVENYVSRGITDFKEQKKALKFAELLKTERGLDEDEADKIAAGTLRYRQNLMSNGSYGILFDEKKKSKYLDTRVDAYSGAASRDSVRRQHEQFLQNVMDFDRANR